MSDEKITIEISLEDAKEFALYESLNPDADSYARFCSQCKAGIDARQTKYEEWLEFRGLPWGPSESGAIVIDSAGSSVFNNTEDMTLVAAAPQMLDALLNAFMVVRNAPNVATAYKDTIREAIRAALPDDVADEVLGE